MYGWRNLRVDGSLCGSIESNVAKIGVAWSGRNESIRHDVLFSWTLQTEAISNSGLRRDEARSASPPTYLNLLTSHSTALIAGFSSSLLPIKHRKSSTTPSSC